MNKGDELLMQLDQCGVSTTRANGVRRGLISN